jgi:hypothetical protein
MAQKRLRNWARKYLKENGPSTTQEILEFIEKKSPANNGAKSARSLGMVLKADPQIRKVDKATLTGETGVKYSVNLWAIKEEKI